ncbi:MAG: CHASE domain-containing protein, partial [Hyphomicrobiaceae bacterium]|nr:CHASE domain-containing protein [Hyphomicrobiaceae bacterium]
VLTIGVVLSIGFWRLTETSIETRAVDRFGDMSVRIMAKIRLTMTAYEQVLRGGAGLLKTNDRVSRSEFQSFIAAMNIARDYPGLQGIGYSVLVPPSLRAAHEAKIQAEGFPGYRIKPDGKRDLYSAIIYLEPFDWRNKRAFGYDMYANPIRREAMNRARDTGTLALSGRVRLVQETAQDVQAGFLLYVPIYKSDLPTTTVKQRREAIAGFVYAPFRTGKLIEALLERELQWVRNQLAFAIYDGDKTNDSGLMFKTANYPALQSHRRYRHIAKTDFHGHTWTLVFTSTKAFDTSVSHLAGILALISGLLLTTLLTAFIAIKSIRQIQLARMNAQMALLTRELAHRVKNTLAVVQSLASRSLSGQRTIAEGRDVFMKRLHALAHAHSLLLESFWKGASLKALARQELAAFEHRATIAGPDIQLNASSAQTMALVLHELATNATKHGAMSVEDGRLSVRWRIERGGQEPVVRFTWVESGGPRVEPPRHRGFGRSLLDQRLGHGGAAPEIRFEPGGLRYEVAAPLHAITAINNDDDAMIRELMREAISPGTDVNVRQKAGAGSQ